MGSIGVGAIGVELVGWSSSTQRFQPPSRTLTSSCPMARSAHQSRVAYWPPMWSTATTCVPSPTPRASIARAKASGDASCAGTGSLGSMMSTVQSTNRASGMWAEAYSSGAPRYTATSTPGSAIREVT